MPSYGAWIVEALMIRKTQSQGMVTQMPPCLSKSERGKIKLLRAHVIGEPPSCQYSSAAMQPKLKPNIILWSDDKPRISVYSLSERFQHQGQFLFQ